MVNALTLIGGVVAFYAIIHFGLQKEYVVNNSGLILISGASTGIGRHAAESLAKEGYVVLAGVRKESDYNDIIGWNSKDNKGFMIPVKFDVSNHESIVSAIDIVKSEMTKRNLPLVAVVNNAGIGRNTILEYHDIADAKYLFDINVFGLLDLTQMTLPLLRLSKGRIVNIGSVAGFFTLPENAVYSASKFAVEALTDALRREVDHLGISVSLIEPAYVKTSIFGSAASNKISEISSDMQSVYHPFFTENKMKIKANPESYVHSIGAQDCSTTTTPAIINAITSSHPKTRYPVSYAKGIPAWCVRIISNIFPDRYLDWVLGMMNK